MKTNFGKKLKKGALTLTAILALTGATKAINVDDDDQYSDSIENVITNAGLEIDNNWYQGTNMTEWIHDDDNGIKIFDNVDDITGDALNDYLGTQKLILVDSETMTNQNAYNELCADSTNNPEYTLIDATGKSFDAVMNEINNKLGISTIEESFPYVVTGQMNSGAYLVALNEQTQDTLGTSNSPLFGLNFNQNNDTIQARFIVDGYPDSQNLDTIIELYSGQNNVVDLRTDPIFTGIDSYKENATSVFPNPCTSSVTVDFDETDANGRVEMYDMQGRLVQADQERAGEDIRLNTQGLAPGTYILNISSDNNQGGATYKVIKQ
ncbi:MAG: T9SS type A sorting domain-containing protein [Candidatus Woesearchaeota archaeon]